MLYTPRISDFIRAYAPELPELSRETISQAAQSALQQLPWVLGTLAAYSLLSYSPKIIFVIHTSLTLLSICSDKSNNLLTQQLLKVTFTVFALLRFGFAASFFTKMTFLSQQLLQTSFTFYSLPIVLNLYISFFIGKMLTTQGVFWKNFAEDKELINTIATSFAQKRLDQIWEKLDEMKLSHWILPLQKIYSTCAIEELLNYLTDHPNNLEKAKVLFPSIFTYQDDFQTLQKKINLFQNSSAQTIQSYFLREFSSPFTSDQLQGLLESSKEFDTLHLNIRNLEDFLFKLKTLKKVKLLNTDVGEKLLAKFNETVALELEMRTTLASLKTRLSEQLKVKKTQRLDHILDKLGFTAGDYQDLSDLVPRKTHFSTRQSVVQALNERGVYCLEDLSGKNLIGTWDKTALVQQMARFLKDEKLNKLPDTMGEKASKTSRLVAAFFSTTLTMATLAFQFAGAPRITALGVAYGLAFRQKGINPARCRRDAETSLYFPQSFLERVSKIYSSLATVLPAYHPSLMGKGITFFFAVNQGETLRDYIDQNHSAIFSTNY